MSTVLQPGGAPGRAAAWPKAQADVATDVFTANRGWEIDRAMMLERSERRAWRVAAASVLAGVVAAAAVFVQGPLRQVVPLPVVVDRTTGETTIQQRLSVETIPLQDALDKHNLAAFVRAREGYHWMFLQRDFEQVARMSVPAVFNAYSRQFDGDGALQKKLAGSEDWRIEVIGVRLLPGGRSGNRGEATVTYDKVVRATDRNVPDVTTRHVASVVYEYQPKVLAREKDRMENPFGFVVSAYRTDPEVNTPAPGVKP